MGDSLSIIFATIVALIMLFFVPLVDTWELQDNLSYVVSYASVTEFVDTIRNTGFISMENYQNFITTLDATGNRFAITMEHMVQDDELSMPFRSKGKYRSVYLNNYTFMIMDSLNTSGIYYLNTHDYFYVTIKNTNVTQATMITNMIMPDKTYYKIGCSYGGVTWNTQA